MPVKGWVPKTTREQAQKPACEECGGTSHVGLHHMDEDRTNNSPENLRTLCAACHTRWHWENGKQAWRRHSHTCVVCGKAAKRSGLCETHRSRLLRHGSPYLRKTKRGSTWLWVAADGPQSGQEWAECPPASLTGWPVCEPSATRSFPRSRSGSAGESSNTKKDR